MPKGNHSYIVKYAVNGMTLFIVDGGMVDGTSELHAKRFSNRFDAEVRAKALKANGAKRVTIVKVGLRKGGI